MSCACCSIIVRATPDFLAACSSDVALRHPITAGAALLAMQTGEAQADTAKLDTYASSDCSGAVASSAEHEIELTSTSKYASCSDMEAGGIIGQCMDTGYSGGGCGGSICTPQECQAHLDSGGATACSSVKVTCSGSRPGGCCLTTLLANSRTSS